MCVKEKEGHICRKGMVAGEVGLVEAGDIKMRKEQVTGPAEVAKKGSPHAMGHLRRRFLPFSRTPRAQRRLKSILGLRYCLKSRFEYLERESGKPTWSSPPPSDLPSDAVQVREFGLAKLSCHHLRSCHPDDPENQSTALPSPQRSFW